MAEELKNELSSRPVTDAAQELIEEIDDFKNKKREEIIKDIDALERVARIGGLEWGYTLQWILESKKQSLKEIENPHKMAKNWLNRKAPDYVLDYIDSLKKT